MMLATEIPAKADCFIRFRVCIAVLPYQYRRGKAMHGCFLMTILATVAAAATLYRQLPAEALFIHSRPRKMLIPITHRHIFCQI